MKLSPRTHFYLQLDRRNQPIPGTLVARQKAPKTGRWRLVPTEPCCAAFDLVYTPADVTASAFTLSVTCDATNLIVVTVTPDVAPTSTIADVVAALNKKAGYVGKFYAEGDDIHLQLNSVLALNCADAADLAFTVVP